MKTVAVVKASTVGFMQKLHREDEGMETIQIIMILAVAAMVLTGVNSLTGISSSGQSTGGGLFAGLGSALGQIFGMGDLGGSVGGLIDNLF